MKEDDVSVTDTIFFCPLCSHVQQLTKDELLTESSLQAVLDNQDGNVPSQSCKGCANVLYKEEFKSQLKRDFEKYEPGLIEQLCQYTFMLHFRNYLDRLSIDEYLMNTVRDVMREYFINLIRESDDELGRKNAWTHQGDGSSHFRILVDLGESHPHHGNLPKSRRRASYKKRYAHKHQQLVAKSDDDVNEMPNKPPPPVYSHFEPVYVLGRYEKHLRGVPNSAWVIDGKRIGDSSVEEEIQLFIKRGFGAASVKFMSSGREDADVRMLGTGRPFAIQVTKPTRQVLSPDLSALTQAIHNARPQPYVTVNKLRYDAHDPTNTNTLNKDSTTKRKSYRCVVHVTGRILTPPLIDYLNAHHRQIVLSQWTPIRVLHRRPNMAREKHIYKVALEFVNASFAILDVETSSGTYVKEFVSGDFGRTMPSFIDLCVDAASHLQLANMDQLKRAQADIMQLDVTSVASPLFQ